MKLQEVLKFSQTIKIQGSENPEIEHIQIDSRNILKNDLFAAIKGYETDGHLFIDKAIEMGATAILCEDMPENLNENVTYIKVADTRVSLAECNKSFYNDPSSKLNLIGVTGTNGKTSIATLLYELFTSLGYKSGLISTISTIIDKEKTPASLTTPDPIAIHNLLSEMVKQGCKYCFMEVSSHAVVQLRTHELTFKGGIFTNLTQDHLDFHKTMHAYAEAKKQFFDMIPTNGFVVTNSDSEYGDFMVNDTNAKKITYALNNNANFKASIEHQDFSGMTLNINGNSCKVKFTGEFNAYNIMAVYATAAQFITDEEKIQEKLSLLAHVAGRFNIIRRKDGLTAIVDYAHTPDAVAKVLMAINKVNNQQGKVITIVGAGGNRDKTKRPIMAQEAYKNSDFVVLTSDNPRFEDPEMIIEDMAAGLKDEDANCFAKITDRGEAIKYAIEKSNPKDIILLAGKGHEDYQIIQGVKHHFDDREMVAELFEAQVSI